MSGGSPRVGVVGHTEWLDFAVVAHLPVAGEIVTAHEHFEVPAGGGAVAAVQLRKLAGAATFLCAVGEDRLGERSLAELRDEHGLEVHAAQRARPQRRAFTHVDRNAERTITVLGERLVPRGEDPLPWRSLADLDGIYFTGGDADAVRAARRAPVLVATSRAADALAEAGAELEVLLGSANDEREREGVERLRGLARWTVLTHGAQGGSWQGADGTSGSWPVAPPPGAPVDAYGCGDSFAAGVTYALAAGQDLPAALALGARCGAYCLTGRGPYAAQLTLA